MHVEYGSGVLPIVPETQFGVDEPPPQSSVMRSSFPGQRPPPSISRGKKKKPSQERQKTYLESVSRLGVSTLFREVIGDAVVEVAKRGDKVTSRWLDSRTADPILRTHEMISGKILFDQIPRVFDADLYFPGFPPRGPNTITLPGFTATAYVKDLNAGVKDLKAAFGKVPGMDREFVRELLQAVELAQQNRLVFHKW